MVSLNETRYFSRCGIALIPSSLVKIIVSNQLTTDQPAQPEISPDEHQLVIKAYWKQSYETFYKVAFQEALSAALADRWLRADTVINILVAVTASSSAIAGWALWQQPGGNRIWLIIAGLVSILSIIHGGIQVPTRLKEQEDYRRQLSRLRVDLETFRQKLELGLGTVELFEKSYTELRSRYADLIYRAPSDIANTHRFRVKIQTQVNEVLKGEIHEQQ